MIVKKYHHAYLGKTAHPEMGMVGRVFRGTWYLASPAFATLFSIYGIIVLYMHWSHFGRWRIEPAMTWL